VLRGGKMPKAMVNGININYRVQGKGEPLILINGGIVERRGWILQICAFKKHYRVITFDSRGIGKSDKLQGPCSMKMMADDTVGLMDYLGICKAHILGISLGGMVAQVIAINYPERINKLILASTFARRDNLCGIAPELPKALGKPLNWTDDDARSIPMPKLLGTIPSLAFNTVPFRIILIKLPLIKMSLTDMFIKLLIHFGRMTYTGLNGQREALLGHNTINSLHKIKVPTLVIRGTKDRIINPISSKAMAMLIPNAKLEKVEGGSHAFFVERRGEFNKKVLDFLRA
jgi:pimeloyl-ACP methyl ester carboxylesterase